MNAHLELWNKLFDNFLVLSRTAVRRGGRLVLEWPTRCRYWKHPKVVALLGIPELGWSTARVKACARGQRITAGRHKGKALTKMWRLMSTMDGLPDAMAAPVMGDHDHVTTGGSWTLRSGKYPIGFADAFHRYFRTVACNNKRSYAGCCIDIPDATV